MPFADFAEEIADRYLHVVEQQALESTIPSGPSCVLRRPSKRRDRFFSTTKPLNCFAIDLSEGDENDRQRRRS